MTTTTKTYRVEFKPYREPMEIHAPDAASAIAHAGAFEPAREVSAVFLKVSDGLTIDEPVAAPPAQAPYACWRADTARIPVGTLEAVTAFARLARTGDVARIDTSASVTIRVECGDHGGTAFVDLLAVAK